MSRASMFALAIALAQSSLPCRPYLVPCNYGEFFNGTLHWHSTLADVTEDVTVTVTAGKAVCTGTSNGPGLVVVEIGRGMEDAPDQPWYSIAVACPTTRPAEMNGSEYNTYRQKSVPEPKLLEGKIEEEHPDADPVNGVTGTIKMSWSLKRRGS